MLRPRTRDFHRWTSLENNAIIDLKIQDLVNLAPGEVKSPTRVITGVSDRIALDVLIRGVRLGKIFS